MNDKLIENTDKIPLYKYQKSLKINNDLKIDKILLKISQKNNLTSDDYYKLSLYVPISQVKMNIIMDNYNVIKSSKQIAKHNVTKIYKIIRKKAIKNARRIFARRLQKFTKHIKPLDVKKPLETVPFISVKTTDILKHKFIQKILLDIKSNINNEFNEKIFRDQLSDEIFNIISEKMIKKNLKIPPNTIDENDKELNDSTIIINNIINNIIDNIIINLQSIYTKKFIKYVTLNTLDMSNRSAKHMLNLETQQIVNDYQKNYDKILGINSNIFMERKPKIYIKYEKKDLGINIIVITGFIICFIIYWYLLTFKHPTTANSTPNISSPAITDTNIE